MNEIISKFLLVRDKSTPEMHLRQPGITYSACVLFTKNNERIQKCKETEDSRYIQQSVLDKGCFQYDMLYRDFKHFPKTTASDKILREKAFSIAKNPKYNKYHRGLALLVYKFFHKKSPGSGIKSEILSNQELAEDLQKEIIRKFR